MHLNEDFLVGNTTFKVKVATWAREETSFFRNNNLLFLSAQISFKHTEAYLVLGNEAK